MRIDRVHLTAYGPFTNHTLDLTAPGVHLIIGPNEAGKSSTLRAITDALFGIPVQTKAGFVHDMTALEIGLDLRKRDDTLLSFRRLKKRKDDLRDADDKVIHPEAFAAFLGPIKRSLFTTMYGIDHNQLVDGGAALLAGEGEVGEAIFGAVSGVTNLHALMARLEGESDALFKPGGSTPKLNVAIKRFTEADKQKRDMALKPARYVDLVNEIGRLEAIAGQHRDEQLDLNRRRDLCQLLLAVLPNLRRRRTAQASVDELAPTVRRLRADLTTELVDAVAAIESSRADTTRLDAEIVELTDKIGAIAVDRPLLAKRTRIGEIREARDRFTSAQRNRPEKAAEADAAEQSALTRIARLRPGLALADAGLALTIETTTVARIRELVTSSAVVATKHEAATDVVATTADELASAEAKLEALPVVPDHALLDAALDATSAAGDLIGQVATAQASLDATRTDAERRVAELGLGATALGTIATLVVPAVATVDSYRTEFDGLTNTAQNLAVALATLHGERSALVAALDELQATIDVPSEADLTERRTTRDQQWTHLRARWLTTGPIPALPPEASITTSADAVADGDAFEAAMHGADDIGDRLRREAQSVARRAELQSQLTNHDDRLAVVATEIAASESTAAATRARWLDLWAPVAIEPGTPAEMNTWLTEHAELARTARDAARLTAEITRLEALIDSHRRDLLAGLAAAGIELATDTQLETLRGRAETARQTAATVAAERQGLAKEIDQLTRRQQAAARDLTKATFTRLTWRSDWAEAMARIGHTAETTPKEAAAFLDEARQLTTDLAAIAELRSRVEQMDDYLTKFADDVREVVAVVAEDLLTREALSALDALVERLDLAIAADGQAATHSSHLEGRTAARAVTARALEAATEQLRLLMEEAGVDTEADLRAAVESSDRLRHAETAVEEIDDEIANQSNGRNTADLLEALGEGDEASLEARIRVLDLDLEQVGTTITDSSTILGTLGAELQTLDGSAAAANAATEAQFALSEIEALADEYLAVRLAAELLRDQISSFREANQAPVLRRAAPWFADLTCGSFTTLDTDLDDKGNTVLEAVRANGDRVGVLGMSEGTSDQLYLALRLAALAESALVQEPFPLVLDDLLMTFDDQRAHAALTILGDVACDVQVLVFAHHEHLRAIAADALGDRVTIHDLEGRATTAPAN